MHSCRLTASRLNFLESHFFALRFAVPQIWFANCDAKPDKLLPVFYKTKRGTEWDPFPALQSSLRKRVVAGDQVFISSVGFVCIQEAWWTWRVRLPSCGEWLWSPKARFSVSFFYSSDFLPTYPHPDVTSFRLSQGRDSRRTSCFCHNRVFALFSSVAIQKPEVRLLCLPWDNWNFVSTSAV